MPRVSVVVPTYNRAHLICETLDSVLAQTYRDFEVIVVDDGSTDETLAVLSKYGGRIRVVCQPHRAGGAGAFARNTGIREATGKFVAFLDSDDTWLPTKLERQVALLDAHSDLSWVYSDAEAFDGETGRTLGFFSQGGRQREGDVLQPLFLGCFIPSPTPIVRRTVFSEVGDLWPLPTAEDWDMWLRIAARYHVGLVPEPLARYRVHEASITGRQNWREQYAAHLTVIERAVAREPQRLAPLRKRAMANICVGTGRLLASRGQITEAREMFAGAITSGSRIVEACICWAGCLTGRRMVSAAFRLRRWLRQIRQWMLSRRDRFERRCPDHAAK